MAGRTIVQAGRAKAYRPLPAAARHAAVVGALEAWERGDWFEAHELLEPAWMGSADLGERLRLQAVIKLAAGFVHGARGNRTGMRTNLVGARERLVEARSHGAAVENLFTAVGSLLGSINEPAIPLEAIEAPDLRRLLGEP